MISDLWVSLIFPSDKTLCPAAQELSKLDGTNGFILNGFEAGDESDSSVASAGDVNGDGINDLIIAAHEANPNENGKAGQIYVVFGTLASR
jgi:hypothetical protein